MVCDLFVIGITAFSDPFVTASRKNLLCKGSSRRILHKPLKIPVDLLCHRTGQHSGIRSRIGHQLLFIQFLRKLQRFIRTDLKTFRTFVLKFCQVIQKGRITRLLLPLHRQNQRFLRNDSLQFPNQRFCIFFFLKAVFFIQQRRLIVGAAFHCPPFTGKPLSCQLLNQKHPVKRRLYKASDLSFSADHHPQHTGHDPSYRDHGSVRILKTRHRTAVLKRQKSGKIDPHQIILFGPQICGIRQMVIFRQILCFPDPS